jgi:hypothetical protein
MNYIGSKRLISRLEAVLLSLLRERGLNVYKIPVGFNSRYELDIFIPSLNIGIELNGYYWHSLEFHEPGYHAVKVDYFYLRALGCTLFGTRT